MPAEGTQFGLAGKQKLVVLQKSVANGLPVIYEGLSNFGEPEFLVGRAGTGNDSLNPIAGVADVSVSQTGNIILFPDAMVPPGMRIFPTKVSMHMRGMVNWGVTSPTAGAIPYLSLQGTDGIPVFHVPFQSLLGGVKIASDQSILAGPMLLGPSTVNGPLGTPVTTFTYVASTGVITAGAASFVANVGVGGIARVVDGAGIGQAAIVTAVGSTTTCTVTPPFTGLDATSVIALDYQAIKTATSTTTSTLYNSTNYTASAFLNNSMWITGVLGTGVGQTRQITASTTAGALTYPVALTTNFDTTSSLVYISDDSSNNGFVDCCVNSKSRTLNTGKGLQLVVNPQSGTSPVGSNVRVYCEFFIAP